MQVCTNYFSRRKCTVADDQNLTVAIYMLLYNQVLNKIKISSRKGRKYDESMSNVWGNYGVINIWGLIRGMSVKILWKLPVI